MENMYLNLFAFLLDIQRRQQLGKTIDDIYLEYPYDILWHEISKEKVTLTKEDFLAIVKVKLTVDDYLFFKAIPSEVSNVIGYRALESIVSNNKLYQISKIIQSEEDITKKLEKISTTSSSAVRYGDSKSKLFSDFELKEIPDLFFLFHYGVTKEELAVICAFTGRGKTSIMLSFVREACASNLKTLYISIKDFSETMLKKRLMSTNDFPDFYACCYSDLSISQLEVEIDKVKPDIVFVDYLGVMSSSTKSDQRRYELEQITSDLKRLAQDKNVIMVTAHQLNKDNPFPKADDLLEAKAGIVSHADLVLGLGGEIQSEYRNVTTIKARRHPALTEFLINFNFADLTYDYENYEEEKDVRR